MLFARFICHSHSISLHNYITNVHKWHYVTFNLALITGKSTHRSAVWSSYCQRKYQSKIHIISGLWWASIGHWRPLKKNKTTQKTGKRFRAMAPSCFICFAQSTWEFFQGYELSLIIRYTLPPQHWMRDSQYHLHLDSHISEYSIVMSALLSYECAILAIKTIVKYMQTNHPSYEELWPYTIQPSYNMAP